MTIYYYVLQIFHHYFNLFTIFELVDSIFTYNVQMTNIKTGAP